MSNTVQRILIFFLGVPAVVSVIVLLPGLRHLAAVLVTLAMLGACALELASLFSARGVPVGNLESGLLALVFPIAVYATNFAPPESPWFVPSLIALGAVASAAVFARLAFAKAEDIPGILPRAGALALVLAYLGLLGSFIVLIASETPRSTQALLTFSLLCFSNDGLAWLTGMTLGRRRGIVAVSPNKSLAGFIGGMAGSTAMAFLCALAFPDSMPGPRWRILALGFLVGAAAIVGDLFESALKRSAGAKDSGSSVPGRGGFLDSFDSLLLAAPVFYALTLAMGLFR